MGVSYDCMGKYEEALNIFLKCLNIKQNTLGKGNISCAKTLKDIGNIFQAMGRYEEGL